MKRMDDSPNHKALADFRYQLRKFLAVSADAAREVGIDPTQHQLLLVIKGSDSESTNIGEIADRLLIRHHSAVELVNRCERNEWVIREKDEHDRRQVRVHLTQKGEGILAELSAVHTRELQTSGPELIQTLTTILRNQSENTGAE